VQFLDVKMKTKMHTWPDIRELIYRYGKEAEELERMDYLEFIARLPFFSARLDIPSPHVLPSMTMERGKIGA
jgi:hypothetical protein